jgi:hypothetical protein
MRPALTRITVSVAALLFVVSSSLAADKPQTYVGRVSDAMCGAEHMEAGVTAADCTRDCVSKGSKYALIVGEKVYTLDGEDKAALDELNQLADQKAKVTGTGTGDTIQVKSVAPAK